MSLQATGQGRSLDAIATTHGLTLEQAFFVALKKSGLDNTAAYRLVKPDVTPESANVQGARWNGKFKRSIETLSLTECQILLTDIRLLTMVASAPDDIALKATDQTSKLLGRYADAAPVISIGVRVDAAMDVEAPEPPMIQHEPRD